MGGVGGGWRERPCPPSFPWRTPVSSPAHTPECREHPRETEEGPCVQGPGQSGKQGPRHFSRDHRGPGSRSVPGHCAAIAAAGEGHATAPGAQGHPHRTAQGLPSPVGPPGPSLAPAGLWASLTVRPLLPCVPCKAAGSKSLPPQGPHLPPSPPHSPNPFSKWALLLKPLVCTFFQKSLGSCS